MNSIHSILKLLALAGLSLLAGMGQDRQFASASSTPAASPLSVAHGPCVADALTLCLNGGRFEVRVNWRVPDQGTSGVGTGVALTGDTGYFWFFSPNNVELVVKVVDGRTFNGMYWVLYGALSNVEYTITVTDTVTELVKTYTNPFGNLASVADTAAFDGSIGVTTGEEESRAQSPKSDAGESGPGDIGASTLDVRPALAAAACTPG